MISGRAVSAILLSCALLMCSGCGSRSEQGEKKAVGNGKDRAAEILEAAGYDAKMAEGKRCMDDFEYAAAAECFKQAYEIRPTEEAKQAMHEAVKLAQIQKMQQQQMEDAREELEREADLERPNEQGQETK